MNRSPSYLITLAIAVALPVVCAAERSSTLDRDQIDDRYKWDLSSVYSDWGVWEADLESTAEAVASFASYRGSLDRGPDQLAAALTARSSLLADAEAVWAYAFLHQVEDTRRQDVQQRLDLANRLRADARNAVSWIVPELLDIPEEQVASWVEDHPALSPDYSTKPSARRASTSSWLRDSAAAGGRASSPHSWRTPASISATWGWRPLTSIASSGLTKCAKKPGSLRSFLSKAATP